MPRSSTQEEFLSKAVKVSKPNYDLSRVKYVAAKTKVEVVCTRDSHGPFLVTPNNFLSGKGCPKCADIDKGIAERELHGGLFFLRSYEAHRATYSYSKTVYSSAHELVTVTCRTHGDFLISPNNHIRGQGCRECAYIQNGLNFRLTYSEFLASVEKENPLYSPCSRTEYTAREELLWMNCSLHGDFRARACTIMLGRGCSKCAKYGYRPNDPGSFYVMGADNLTKIGITNRDSSTRLLSIRRSSGIDFNVQTSIKFEDGVIPITLEKCLLRELRATHTQPAEKFDGSTECFYNVDQSWLLNRIDELIKELTPPQEASKLDVSNQEEVV